METVLLVIGIAAVILLAALIVIVLLSNKNKVDEQYLARQISADISRQQSELRQELTAQTQNSVGAMGGMLEQRLQGFAAENQRSLNSIRDTVEKRLNEIQTDNARQLDEMRSTVDEKLNKSLDEKFSNSFSLVSQRLEQVYKGLGEMQNLAVGVGDLKKVLSNVKTRGILGEIQLGSILAESTRKMPRQSRARATASSSPLSCLLTRADSSTCLSTRSSRATHTLLSAMPLKAATRRRSRSAKRRCSALSAMKPRTFTTSTSTRRTQPTSR